MRIRAGLAVVVLGLVGALGLAVVPGGTDPPPLVETVAAKVAPIGDPPSVETAVVAAQDAFFVDQQRQIDEYLAWQYEQDVAAWAAAHPPRPVPRATPAPRAAPVVVDRPVVSDGDIWWQLALCECGGNPACNTGNGFYGTFQFVLSTWQSVGGSGYPHEHSYEEQLHRAQILQARSGWGQWPACARKLGLL